MSESVNHPAYYNTGKIKVIDFIEDQKLGFSTGNAVKYIARAVKKNPNTEIEDLRKAVWYLNRRIAELEAANETIVKVDHVSVIDAAWIDETAEDNVRRV